MKLIPLTKGQFAIVDNKDFKWLSMYKWCALKRSNGYAAVRTEHGSPVLMHRAILKCPTGVYVDHANGNPLDNRRKNIRLCTGRQNSMNRAKQSNNTSGYKGVFYHKLTPKHTRHWQARVGSRKPWMKSGGYFVTAKAAAKKYDQLAKIIHGKFAKLNFP